MEEASAPLNSWGGCSARLEASELYWLATTRRDGRPHVVPVGAVWVEDRLWFNTSRQTVIARTLANEPRAVVHLESAEDVLIVEGFASLLDLAQVPADVVVAYTDKYGGEWDGGDPDSLWLWFTIDPRSAMSWSFSDMRNTAIRVGAERAVVRAAAGAGARVHFWQRERQARVHHAAKSPRLASSRLGGASPAYARGILV